MNYEWFDHVLFVLSKDERNVWTGCPRRGGEGDVGGFSCLQRGAVAGVGARGGGVDDEGGGGGSSGCTKH